MEAAATRAVHGDPVAAAAALREVIDLWDRIGDSTQQWLNLRYVVRLLTRVDAGSDAATLHEFLVAAGKPSPLDGAGSRTPYRRDAGESRAVERAAVAHAHAALSRVV
jgi:hypothetical protein